MPTPHPAAQMANCFIISVDVQATAAQRDAITVGLKGQVGVAWWHLFQFTWAVLDLHDRDAAWWRDFVRGLAPSAHVLVVAARGDWAAFGDPGTFLWFYEYLPRPRF